MHKAKNSKLVEELKLSNYEVEYYDIDSKSNPHLGKDAHELRLDYSRDRVSYRLNGNFGGHNDAGGVVLPHLMVIQNHAGGIHNDYIIAISKAGKTFGLIRKLNGDMASAERESFSFEDLGYYANEASIGLSLIRDRIETGGRNDYMFQDKEFTINQKLNILKDVARTSSVIAVLNASIDSATSRGKETVDKKEVAELLELHRLI